ncbi:MAG TPA: Holliday junction resolvase RuvX, partial [Steroidobacteraceae bacterium]|nr:Holliday junction resolvase RuvX [Steroidobacteraceae bacterium]
TGQVPGQPFALQPGPDRAPVARPRGAPDDAGPDVPRLVLAFDFGRRRIGVACGNTLRGSASPLAAIANAAGGPSWSAVDSLLREWQPDLIVVGLPYNADGSESVMSAEARDFSGELARRYALPVRLVDERYSSLEAESRLKALRESGLRKRRVTKTAVDAGAACIILERWLTEST